ncbi:ion transporter [Lactiplantibacillus plantarum]|uniref:potassium channel family protein n=1 Tax=Lactiplantibacillus plantarum TaxID=1590 RepID=UPI000855102A|nr:potassium channel family protein [Lactiplantibacillus plantarum]AOG31008.1 ion transporter [Lactiplantibacillus plantarum]MCS6093952.1 ion transporter [Lactobacillus sp. LMY-20]MDR7676874.1 potassium channel family protein [Lactiplantibacillus plantarum]
MKYAHKTYELIIGILALFSVAITIFDFSGVIDLNSTPWNIVDDGILIIFTLDYVSRFIEATDKKYFFKHNIFDLLAIIPFNSMFTLFRFSRMFRVLRLFKLFKFVRLIGFIGKAQSKLKKFSKINGFIYLLWVCLAILFISATLYSIAENVSWGDAMWWAIVTSTTVGYGDISPHTLVGRFAAVLLMLIGVGFIGILTSTITSYFAQEDTSNFDKLYAEIKKLETQNEIIQDKLKALENKQEDK